ncbi:MAG: acyl-CoA dehydrogenase family protein [Nitrososphaeria archaeon]
MASEEQKLLVSMIEQFAKEELENVAQKIEKEGISKDIRKRLAELGLLAATLPQSENGAGIDRSSFSLVLMTIAKYSASVAYFIYLQNTLVNEILFKAQKRKEEIAKIASGESTGTLVHDINLNFPLEIYIKGHELYGANNFVILPDADFHLVLARSEKTSYLVMANPVKIEKKKPLGFRAISFGFASYKQTIEEDRIILKDADNLLKSHIFDTSDQIASIAIGMSESALEKAIEYSKERKAFESYLYEFQPISAVLSDMKGRIEEMKKALMLSEDTKDRILLKLNALELARSASRLALQIYGGYGYLEDLGIERYYRDSMYLTMLSSNYIKDIEIISKNIISPDAFKI